MTRILLLLTLLVLAIPAKAQTTFTDGAMVRQFVAAVEGSPQRVAERLAADLPPGSVQGRGDLYTIGYSGTSAPVPLIRFLASTFEELAEDGPQAGRPLNLSLFLRESNGGTEVRAMLVSRASENAVDAVRAFHLNLIGAPVPVGAEIIMGGGADGRGGDLVLSLRGSVDVTRAIYAEALATHGYEVSQTAIGSSALVQAERDDALVMIFIQSDPDSAGRSVVVIRSMEDA